MKKVTRKVPQSVKTQRKIDAAVQRALTNQIQVDIKQNPDPSPAIQSILEKIDRRQVIPLLERTSTQKSLIPVKGPNGLMIPNVGQGWKLFSNIAFASIIGTQAFFANLDPEIIASLPDNIQYYVTAIQAVVGIAARLINQTKLKKGVANV